MSILRPCIVCGAPSDLGTRCAAHPAPRPPRKRPPSSTQGWDRAWQRLSRRARQLQPWCSWCGTTEDLTGDHLRWPAETLDDVQVLCRRCNSRKGPLRQRVTPTVGRDPQGEGAGWPRGEAKSETDSGPESAWGPR